MCSSSVPRRSPMLKPETPDGRVTHSRCERVHSPSWDGVEGLLWGICIGDLATEAVSWQAAFLMPEHIKTQKNQQKVSQNPYLETTTILAIKQEVCQIHLPHPLLCHHPRIRSIPLRRIITPLLSLLAHRHVGFMTVPELHHLCPVLAGKVAPRRHASGGQDDLSASSAGK